MTDIWQQARGIVDERRARVDKRDSVIDNILDEKIVPDVPMSDAEVNIFVGALQMAAADTTENQLPTHILYPAKRPNVQEKARAELDAACGSDRIPRWSDFASCPYINCIVKEGNRVHAMYVSIRFVSFNY